MSNEVLPLAHIAADGRRHLLIDHLNAVASGAAKLGQKVGSEAYARLAGLWHDIGKYSGDFQAMIHRENGLDAHIEVEGGPRDHSTAGALLVMAQLKAAGLPIALAIAGHHAGLADGPAALKDRLERKAALLDAIMKRSPAAELLNASLPVPPEWAREQTARLRLEMWTRMMFSALCDADFLDTEAFFDGSRVPLRGVRSSVTELAEHLQQHMAAVEAAAPSTIVNAARAEVRAACLAAASHAPGLFNLTVPTGGGKTLASMAFALEHAKKHALDRVVVVIPFTSIIEQSARAYREIFGVDEVIEHHSALDPVKETGRNRVSSENWDARIVVTTTVQLFESLLASRPSQCRKLHNLARSVIVLDEAQSLPGRLLPTILDVLQQLASFYGSTVVVATATQPAFGRSATLLNGFESVREICPGELRLFDRLERVSVSWPADDIVPFEVLATRIAAEPSALAIVHRRDDARIVCQYVDRELGDESAVHLSALMTPSHRAVVLADVRHRLAQGLAVRVVSTQLVEAGVDVDFPVVFRALAGLDSLAQAAGRCNREGKLERGELRVFLAETQPPVGVPRTGLDIARGMLRANPSLSLFAPEVQREYFARLYEATDLKLGHEIQALREQLKFKTTSEAFRLIEDDWSAPLVVAHDDGAPRVEKLRQLGPSRGRLRALQPYTINVPKRALAKWLAAGVCTVVADSVHVLEGAYLGAYDARYGLVPDRMGVADVSSFVVG